mmetsp:Transcript_80784/g.250748  ORF Transcript_80784/g.250748 Transcript_80784/m.250748 type:complete len:214 (-) Transcript_80784:626-1267(-)
MAAGGGVAAADGHWIASGAERFWAGADCLHDDEAALPGPVDEGDSLPGVPDGVEGALPFHHELHRARVHRGCRGQAVHGGRAGPEPDLQSARRAARPLAQDMGSATVLQVGDLLLVHAKAFPASDPAFFCGSGDGVRHGPDTARRRDVPLEAVSCLLPNDPDGSCGRATAYLLTVLSCTPVAEDCDPLPARLPGLQRWDAAAGPGRAPQERGL